MSQWQDEDGAISPVYSATTANIPGASGGDGAFVFHYPNWADGNGKVHSFYAKPYKVRVRMWIAPGQKGPGGGELLDLRQAPGVQPGFMNTGDGGNGMWSNVPQSFTFTGIFVYEAPDMSVMVKKDADGNPDIRVDEGGVPANSFASADRGAVTGKVWWRPVLLRTVSSPSLTPVGKCSPVRVKLVLLHPF